MKEWILNMVDPEVAEAFGWSLVHSIWQGLIIAVLLFLFLKFSETVMSTRFRYIVAYSSLIGLVILTVYSFWNGLNTINLITDESEGLIISTSGLEVLAFKERGLLEMIPLFVDNNLDVFVAFWLIGFIVFIIKMVGGYDYLSRLKDRASQVDRSISNIATEIAEKLNLGQNWDLTESAVMRVPAVFGHIRPMIFLPIGMTSELTVDQLRAILSHEMAHIKRNDYLFNLFQSLLEAVYFFNPFVWWISQMIRTERELACDDLALTVNSSRSYVEGLVTVNELSLTRPSAIALAVAGNNKNSLKDRIKRIMKTDMDRRPKELLPLILMAAAFVVPAYFLALDLKDDRPLIQPNIAGVDMLEPFSVTKKNIPDMIMEFPGHPSIPTVERDTVPDLKIDVDIDEAPDIDVDVDFAVDAIDIAVDVAEEMELAMSIIPIVEDLNLLVVPVFGINGLDTIPPTWKDENFEIFTKELKYHMQMLEQQMKELGEEFELKHLDEFEVWQEEHAREMEKMNKVLKESLESMERDFDSEHLMKLEEEMARKLEEINEEDWSARLDRQMMELEEKLSQLPDIEEELREMEYTLQAELAHLEEFENDLTEMLIKDGYIEKGEELNIEFDDEEVIINGEVIKEKEAKKYLELRKKHFPKDDGNFRYRSHE